MTDLVMNTRHFMAPVCLLLAACVNSGPESQLGKHFTEVERSVRRGLAMIGARHGVGSAEEFHRVVM